MMPRSTDKATSSRLAALPNKYLAAYVCLSCCISLVFLNS